MSDNTCPRCGVNPADKWCRSRTDNTTHLCNPCGNAEAMEDYHGLKPGGLTPQSEWPVKAKSSK